ncbi:hypothetical protein D9M69_472810 [compost metagenome]
MADVNGSYSFNAGVRAYDARIGAVDLPNANFYTSDGTMWLLECDPSGSYYDAVQTGTGLVCLCNTPLRRASGLPAFYQQKLGALVA